VFTTPEGVRAAGHTEPSHGINRQRWKTRIALANALFEYLKDLPRSTPTTQCAGMFAPIEYE
jgi:hypothetical protein